jgi:hypothetical protein
LWGSTVTSPAALPWSREPQRRKWCIAMVCACLGGAALDVTGRLRES